jgi:hypothetical protein
MTVAQVPQFGEPASGGRGTQAPPWHWKEEENAFWN